MSTAEKTKKHKRDNRTADDNPRPSKRRDVESDDEDKKMEDPAPRSSASSSSSSSSSSSVDNMLAEAAALLAPVNPRRLPGFLYPLDELDNSESAQFAKHPKRNFYATQSLSDYGISKDGKQYRISKDAKPVAFTGPFGVMAFPSLGPEGNLSTGPDDKSNYPVTEIHRASYTVAYRTMPCHIDGPLLNSRDFVFNFICKDMGRLIATKVIDAEKLHKEKEKRDKKKKPVIFAALLADARFTVKKEKAAKALAAESPPRLLNPDVDGPFIDTMLCSHEELIAQIAKHHIDFKAEAAADDVSDTPSKTMYLKAPLFHHVYIGKDWTEEEKKQWLLDNPRRKHDIRVIRASNGSKMTHAERKALPREFVGAPLLMFAFELNKDNETKIDVRYILDGVVYYGPYFPVASTGDDNEEEVDNDFPVFPKAHTDKATLTGWMTTANQSAGDQSE